MENLINVLFTGYSREDEVNKKYMRANCSCTLIRTFSGKNIIVDTMTAWDGELICKALQKYNLQPSDIHFVVCTHGHSDHIGCNYLFTESEWHIVGTSVSHRDKYWNLECEESSNFSLVAEDVVITPTPGHTLTCISVIVRNSNLGMSVGICGDLFEREEDLLNESLWLEAGSEDKEAQRRTRMRMIDTCDFIIPGHGPGFKVTEDLRTQFREYNLTKKEEF